MKRKIKKFYEIPTWKDKDRCPICNSKLQKRYEGMVCRNLCPLNFKLGLGWVYIPRKIDNLFWTSKYDFDITLFENKRKWLKIKSQFIFEKGKCEICRSKRSLHVHHILPRSSNPELTFDKDNLMVLCESCHKKIHSKDKYSYWRK